MRDSLMTRQQGRNVFSIDLEEWFCVCNLNQAIPFDRWGTCESRVEKPTLAILDLLTRHRSEATFFVVGWVAERHPDLIREVERRGHEIASHSYAHRLVTKMTPDEFRSDLTRSLDVLAKLTTQPVSGFRAPSFSLTRRSWWSLEIMRELGIRYDSSVFPIGFHPDYGLPDYRLDPHQIAEGIWELPMSVALVAGGGLPCCGGRLLPSVPLLTDQELDSRLQCSGPLRDVLHASLGSGSRTASRGSAACQTHPALQQPGQSHAAPGASVRRFFLHLSPQPLRRKLVLNG